MFEYFCYGLTIHSEQSIPFLLATHRPGESADVILHWKAVNLNGGNWQTVTPNRFRQRQRIETAVNASSGGVGFKYQLNDYGEVATLIQHSPCHQSHVYLDFPQTMSHQDQCSLLVGNILGSVLRLRNTLCLHASVIALKNKSLVLIGSKGAGKSTTSAALAKLPSVTLVSDDIAAIEPLNEELKVWPGYPANRLNEDSCENLRYRAKETVKVFTHTDKHYVVTNVEDQETWQKPRDVSAIVLLDGVNHIVEQPQLLPLHNSEALMALTSQTYANYAVHSKPMIQNEFRQLSRLATTVPSYRCRYTKDFAELPNVCDSLISLLD